MYARLLLLILLLAPSMARAQTCVDYSQGIRWLKNFEPVFRIELVGDQLYALSESLVLLSVADPLAPQVVSTTVLPNASTFDVLDSHVYVTEQDGSLQVFDFSDPAHPLPLGHTSSTADFTLNILAHRDHVYVIGGSPYAVRVFDVSDPQAPQEVGGYFAVTAPQGLTASGDYLYVVDGDKLLILDITDPAQPSLLSTLPTTGSARCVTVSGTTAYVGVASATASLLVVDVSDPSLPEIVGQLALSTVKGVSIVGTRAYLTLSNAIAVADVSAPSNPILLGKMRTHKLPQDMEVSGPHAFVADYEKLQLFDVSQPVLREPIGAWDTPSLASGIFVQGDYAYIADHQGFQIADVSTPSAPSYAGWLDTGTYTRRITVQGPIAYVSRSNSSMLTVDVSNPQTPVLLDWALNTSYGGSYAVVVSGLPPGTSGMKQPKNYAFNAYRDGGLVVGDVSDAVNTFVVGDYDTPFALDIAMSGSLVFLADYTDGLIILDVSDPANPLFESSLATPGAAYCVAAQGNLVYVGDASEAFRVVDVTNPSAPEVVATLAMPHVPLGISLDGTLAYVACQDMGVQVVDVSEPHAPVYVGGVGVAGDVQGVHAINGLVFVVDGFGLKVLPSHCSTPSQVVHGGEPGQPSLRAWPNPVRSVTTLAYSMPSTGPVRLQIFDLRGRLVRTLVAGHQSAGTQLVRWDATNTRGDAVANGIYFARLSWQRGETTNRVTVVR